MFSASPYRENAEVHEKEHKIREALMKAIVEHQLPPGSKLPEEALAEAFGISRTGIRKVLTCLATVQMVNMTPKRGAFVANPDERESRHIFRTRSLVELANLPDVTTRVRPADVQELTEIMMQEHQAHHQRDAAAAIRYSAMFHIRLHAVADNPVVSDIITNLTLRSSLVIAAWGSQWQQGCRESEHHQLLEALQEKDVPLLGSLLQQHFENIVGSLNFNNNKTPPPDFRKLFSA
ncbi:GntR family transcriptional regulator [Tatumella sp. UBA2305]|uniref:GntR family transcriptional regulator n=1 Tax=Tatumella sp. UBA2305 TaxID=1947647 RepID=UPI0025E8F830|nr:GntR family transcriptional regulator [Tatumella sp. UBA2305]